MATLPLAGLLAAQVVVRPVAPRAASYSADTVVSHQMGSQVPLLVFLLAVPMVEVLAVLVGVLCAVLLQTLGSLTVRWQTSACWGVPALMR